MSNKFAALLALAIAGAIGWDVFLNDAYWTTIWSRRLFLIINELAFWR